MVDKIISELCIGYNKDFSQSYTRVIVTTLFGKQITLYQTTYRMLSGVAMEGYLTEVKPLVEIPVTPL